MPKLLRKQKHKGTQLPRDFKDMIIASQIQTDVIYLLVSSTILNFSSVF